jgi:hypothetical protein
MLLLYYMSLCINFDLANHQIAAGARELTRVCRHEFCPNITDAAHPGPAHDAHAKAISMAKVVFRHVQWHAVALFCNVCEEGGGVP